LRRKRLISFVYIAARLASFCIEQFAIPEQVVFNLLLYHYAGIILSIIVGAKNSTLCLKNSDKSRLMVGGLG